MVTDKSMTRFTVDRYGTLIELPPGGLKSPVQCAHCSTWYDLQAVTVVGRYADCTTFTTPCCGRQADDRTWKSLPDFRRPRGH